LGTSDTKLCTQGNAKAYADTVSSAVQSNLDTHEASTGASHTYINQSVTSSATPSFAGVSLTGNLAIAANSITGSSVDINNAELQQVSNIGSATISSTQWGYLGNSDQNVRTSDAPTFDGITAYSGAFVVDLDDVDISSGYPLTVYSGSANARDNLLKVQGGGLGSDWIVMIEDSRTDVRTTMTIDQTSDGSCGTGDKHIKFLNSGGEIGAIHSEVVYGTFTGSHDTQTDQDITSWREGMIVSSTGEILGDASMGRALVKVILSETKQDKKVFGVFSGSEENHNKKGFDTEIPAIIINALGEGLILVTDTNGNLEIGVTSRDGGRIFHAITYLSLLSMKLFKTA